MAWFILAPLAVIATIVFCLKTLNLYYIRHKKRPLVRKLTPEEKRKMLEELHRIEEELERKERYEEEEDKEKDDWFYSPGFPGYIYDPAFPDD